MNKKTHRPTRAKGMLKKLTVLLLAFFIALNPAIPAFAVEEAQDMQAAPAAAGEESIAPDDQVQAPPAPTKETKEKPASSDPLVGEASALQSDGPQVFPPVTPSTIKHQLPQSDAVSGALLYSFPITFPPGRNGMQPDLSLTYNNQNIEEGNIAGAGWSFTIPFIERINRKGSEKLYTQNFYQSSLSGELVSLSPTSYKSKVDNGEFLDYTFSNNAWTVKDKKGTTYTFGANAGARQDNPANTAQVFKWMLEEVRDLNDNFIKFEYFKDSGQIYPFKIKYTGNGITDGIFEVEFLREQRPDITKIGKAGFSIITQYRIAEIQTKISGIWVKKYSLGYLMGDNGKHSLLNMITETGQDEVTGQVASLPPTRFDYQILQHAITENTSWSIPVYLSNGNDDVGVRLIDVNGDGLTDMVRFQKRWGDGPHYRNVYINNGINGWVEDTSWTVPSNFFFANYGGGSEGGQIADVNGDNLPDLLLRISVPETNAVYLNTGNGWTLNTNWSIPVYLAYNSEDTGTRLVDVNADGLTDILRIVKRPDEPHWREAYINNGTGWTLDTSWIIPTDFFFANYGGQHEGGKYADVNGDGLVDLLQRMPIPDINKVYLNTGSGWIYDSSWSIPVYLSKGREDVGVRMFDINGDGLTDIVKSFKPSGAPIVNEVYINKGNGWTIDTSWTLPNTNFSFANYGGQDEGGRIADVDGDGLMDLLHSMPTPAINKVYLANGKRANLLTRITYPRGGKTAITYKPTPQYRSASTLQNPKLPLILDTVYQLSHDDGLGLIAPRTFNYEGGQLYYANAFDRKFSGFNIITKTSPQGAITKTFYHQGNATDSGRGEFDDHISKIGKPYRIEIADSAGNIYQKTINTWERADLGNGRNFVKLAQKIDFMYDGNSTHKDKAETYTYDNTNGNLIGKFESGEVSAADNGAYGDVGNDRFITTISYASNASLNILGLPSRETVLDQNSSKVKEARFYYDTLALGTATKGNLTKEEKWVVGGSYIDNEKAYNSFGLVIQEKDPRDKATNFSYDAFNLYPASVVNPLNHVTQLSYDYSSGKVKQTTDPNGRVFQNSYDGLDRIIEEREPDVSNPSVLVTKTLYSYWNLAVGAGILQNNYLDATQSADSYIYTDGFDRPIQKRKEAESAGAFAVSDFIYNSIEQLGKESLPYFSGGTAKTSPTGDASLYATYSYDPLLRITSIQNAVGTTTNTYDDWKLTITDPKGNAKNLYRDAYGNLVKVEELNGATYTTRYAYNYLGNLTNITDALGNIRAFTYDGLGRRLSAQDLHAPSDTTFGIWTYAYDESGNVISQTDPKEQTISYTYDDINRVLTEDFAGKTGIEATYAYDTCGNGVGRICAVQAAAISAFTYHPAGQVKTQTKTIDGTGYVTAYDIDRQGNVTKIIYPDASEVTYTYNTAGQLEAVSNVVSDFDYGPAGKITYEANTNGTATANTYDAAKLYRLTRKLTTGPGGEEGGGGESPPQTAQFYSTNGDGSIYYKNSSWDKAHDAASGNSAPYSEGMLYVRTGKYSRTTYLIERTFFPFDTSSLPDDAVITDAKLKVYVYSKKNHDNDGDDWISVVQTSQPNTTKLTKADYDLAGQTNNPAEGIDPAGRKDISAIAAGAYLSFTLNATGRSWVSKTGVTKLGLREGHDISDSPFVGTSGKYNELRLRTANYSSTAYDPVLEITFTTPAASPPPSPTVIQDISYTYDANGNITQVIDASGTDSAKTVSYAYDALNRLITATAVSAVNGDNFIKTYTYDAIGNITNASDKGAYAYAGTGYANPHAVTSIGSASYTYDNNGNMTGDGTWTNTWNYQNRLIQSQKTGGAITYEYDHAGQRTKYANGVKTTRYANKYFNTDGTTPTKHIFAGDQLVATIEGSTLNYVHTDHLTGSNAVTNSTGGMVQLLDYYPYGSLRIDWKHGNFDEQRKFAGQEFDRETGLNYMNARYYDSGMGRFISQDPAYLLLGDTRFEQRYGRKLESHLTDPQQLNSYSYVTNNPLKHIDETGEIAPLIIAAGLIAWQAGEAGLTAYDAYSTYQTVTDSHASFGEKLGSVGLFGLGLVAPGGGYKSIGGKAGEAYRTLRGIDRASDAYSLTKSQQSLLNNIDRHGSYEKHVLGQREYGTLFQNKEQWREYVGGVIAKPSSSFSGPTKDLYWDDRLGSVVINNKAGGPPTVFRPEQGRGYYETEVAKQKVQMKGGGAR